MKSVKLKHSLLTILGLLLSILIITAFIFMATKFNPQKTRGYADHFFQHSFPQYNVDIDDASVRIGLITTITFKKFQMTPKGEADPFLTIEKAQLKISLSSLIFRKKPIDILLEDLSINEVYLRPFLHQYLIREPLTNPKILIPEFVREVGVNIKSRSFNLKYKDLDFAFSRFTIRGRPNSLWAYEIEGTHLWEGHSFEHITVGEIHFFEKTSQISFYTHNNNFKILESGASYRDLKTQGNIDVPAVGPLSATFTVGQADSMALTVSLAEDNNEIKVREVNGSLPADLYRALGIGHQPQRIGDSTVSFIINDDEVIYNQKNGKREPNQKFDIVDYSYNKSPLAQNLNIQLKQNESPILLNLVTTSPLDELNMIYKSNRLSTLFLKDVNQYIVDIVRQYLPKNSPVHLNQMIFEFDECFQDQLSCRVHLDQNKNKDGKVTFKGDLISSNGKFKANLEFLYDIKTQDSYSFEIKNLNTTETAIVFPVKGTCQFGFNISRRLKTNLTSIKCVSGHLDPAFFSKGAVTSSNFIQFKKFELNLEDDQFHLLITPQKGRSLKISGPYESEENTRNFYFDQQKTIGFSILQNENNFEIVNIGN